MSPPPADRPVAQGLDALMRRGAVFGAALATSALAGVALWELLAPGGAGTLELVGLGLFLVTFLWIALSFWSALAGFFAIVTRARPQNLIRPEEAKAPPLAARTAILLPICNEDPQRVAANLQAMYEDLAATGQGAAFDFFLLSDSGEPAIQQTEEAIWCALSRRLAGAGRVYYRRRDVNHAGKAGNIADFCRRWGGGYDFMVVLDADSLMSGATLVTLARTLAANPRAGLIQVPSLLINRQSLFARLQQFASNLAAPVAAAGLAYWQLGEGNYWGHNAIIRTRAFAANCGLPTLPGRRPFGGTILSHDFVEAALLRRAGWQVWMLPDLGGSYEESPPTLLDYARRDRRWCQGNLQHLRVLAAKGLHPMSRLHLLLGIFSYAVSPLWLLFLALGLAAALLAQSDGEPPIPGWTGSEPAQAFALFAVTLAMLFVPRLLGWFLVLSDGRRARAFGGRLRLSLSLLCEAVVSSLTAPAMMLFHSRFIGEILAGRDNGWDRQARSDGALRAGTVVARNAGQLAAAGLLAAGLAGLPPALTLWFLPLLLGLLLAPLLAFATASPRLGAAARRLGLFLIPEECAASPLVARATALAASKAAPRAPEDRLDRRQGHALGAAIIGGGGDVARLPRPTYAEREGL